MLIDSGSQGMLEWESYSENIGDPISAEGKRTWPWSGSFEALTKANLLLAADVVYDPNFIGALVRAVVKFFKLGTGLEGTERTAIFAPRIGTEQHSACSKMNSSSTRSRQCITF